MQPPRRTIITANEGTAAPSELAQPSPDLISVLLGQARAGHGDWSAKRMRGTLAAVLKRFLLEMPRSARLPFRHMAVRMESITPSLAWSSVVTVQETWTARCHTGLHRRKRLHRVPCERCGDRCAQGVRPGGWPRTRLRAFGYPSGDAPGPLLSEVDMLPCSTGS